MKAQPMSLDRRTLVSAAVGRFDADFEVVGPAELEDACADMARRYTAAASTGHVGHVGH